MSQSRKTTSAQNRIKASRITALAKRAGRLANENRKRGYHCSESVFAAVADVLELTVKLDLPKMASGFHGGDGAVKIDEEKSCKEITGRGQKWRWLWENREVKEHYLGV